MNDQDRVDIRGEQVPVDWRSWLARWDAQQGIYMDRERRFEAVLDLLRVLVPPDFVGVDLACGPGSLSQRVLTRFPYARMTAVDLDPVLLEMGRAVLGDAGGRLAWVEADLREHGWAERLQQRPVQAVLSSTALHWLPLADLYETYRISYQILSSGGILLNADRIPLPRQRATIGRALRQLHDERRDRDVAGGAESWDAWWLAISAVAEVQPLLAERRRRFAWFSRGADQPSAEVHQAALVDAGFDEVDVVWQDLDSRIVAAIKR